MLAFKFAAVASVVFGLFALPQAEAVTTGPSISVSPDRELRPPTPSVEVSGVNFSPSVAVTIAQCESDSLIRCQTVGETTTDAAGAFSTTVTVHAKYSSGPAVDCLVTPTCLVYVSANENATHHITFAKRPSATALAISKTRTKIKAQGAVSPKHVGLRVVVTLAKKRHGHFVTLHTHQPTLNRSSDYTTHFARPTPGTCKVKTKFRGDADHLPSAATKRFNC